MPGLRIRDGKPADLAALDEIETASFSSDRMSRRSLAYHLRAATPRLRVATAGRDILGYHLMLTRAGSAVARLYSIAVAAGARGRGVGERLLADAERVARRRGAATLRLEVRSDNRTAIRLYEHRGYERIGIHRRYYADKADALRLEKRLAPARERAAPASRADAASAGGRFPGRSVEA